MKNQVILRFLTIYSHLKCSNGKIGVNAAWKGVADNLLKAQVFYDNSNITNITVTDKNGKNVSVSKSTDKDGKITLTLPNGADLTGDNYYTIKATDSKGNAKADVSIILKDKKNNSANGTTDKNGMLILPASEHKAYIFGYDDGTFRPDNNMSRAEAAAIFARLISEQKGEKISGKSNFNDVKKGCYTVKYSDVATNYWAYSDVAYAKHAGWLKRLCGRNI